MIALFTAADRFVVVYSSDLDLLTPGPHERHRAFTKWVSQHQPEWRLFDSVPNRYPFDGSGGSRSNFYFFERVNSRSTIAANRGASEA
jgi:hypothetical protein